MSYADSCFISTCKDILQNGISTIDEKVRPKWSDGSYAYTMKKFGVINKYDLRKEFPATTLRKTALRAAMDEILWIYQKKSNNVKDLKSHIWDQWADENGSIGSAYGYQIKKKFKYTINITDKKYGSDIDIISNNLKRKFPSIEISHIDCRIKPDLGKSIYDNKLIYYKADVLIDQMDYVLFELENNPYNRRIMTSLWNTEDLHEMNLYPCTWSVSYSVTREGNDKYLNMFLNQRSQDMLAANNWNTAQYAILLMMVAQVSYMKPGELIHSIVDAHIYDRHIPIVEELIKRETFNAPKVWLNPNIRNFYDFTTDDLHIEDYTAGPQVKFEIAV